MVWVLTVWTMVLVLPVSAKRSKGPTRTEKMNVLFISNEGHTTTAVGCYGNVVVQTPHLDALAQQGVRFTRAYCVAPMGNPSRASTCTGLRPDTTTIYTNQDLMNEKIPRWVEGLATLLGRKGAYLGNVGKLYRGDEANRHYQAFHQLAFCPVPEGFRGRVKTLDPKPCPNRRFQYAADPSLEAELEKRASIFERENKHFFREDARWWFQVGIPYIGMLNQIIGDSGMPETCEEDYRKARLAEDLLRSYARGQQQFFLSVGFSKPQVPVQAPQVYVDRYDPNGIVLLTTPVTTGRYVPAAARRFGAKPDLFTGGFDESFPQLCETPQRQREAVAAYYAATTFIDAQVGHLLQVLRETGLNQNTIIVYFADHGFHLGEHGLWSKYTQFEQVTRVPLIVFVPGASGNGQVCDEIVELVDLLPTLCDMWKIKAPEYMEGISFAPLLHQPQQAWKKAAFNVFNLQGVAQRDITGRTVRTKRYRYTEWGEQGLHGVELYDLETDPQEQTNLALHRKYRPLRYQLACGLRAGWQAALPESPYELHPTWAAPGKTGKR